MTNNSTTNDVGERFNSTDTNVEKRSGRVSLMATKSECLDHNDQKKGTKIKTKGKHKKERKHRQRKLKAAKSSSCSLVDIDEEDVQTAARIQNLIEEQKRILNIITKKEHRLSRSYEKNLKCKHNNENEVIDIEPIFSRGACVSTSTQLLEKVEQSDDTGKKKNIRIKRKNKIEVKQEPVEITSASWETPSEQDGKSATGTGIPAMEIDISDIG
jgi:hypothetical protein